MPGTIMDLRETTCRWPLGDPSQPDFRFCCDPVDGKTYCAKHRALAYQPRESKNRSADRHSLYVASKEGRPG
jgi:GcrA cell cycle regulator